MKVCWSQAMHAHTHTQAHAHTSTHTQGSSLLGHSLYELIEFSFPWWSLCDIKFHQSIQPVCMSFLGTNINKKQGRRERSISVYDWMPTLMHLCLWLRKTRNVSVNNRMEVTESVNVCRRDCHGKGNVRVSAWMCINEILLCVSER